MNDSETNSEPLPTEESAAQKHFSMGRHFQSAGQYDRAIVQFRASLAIEPNDALAHAFYALSLSSSSYHADAKTEAKIALDLAPNVSVIQFINGAVLNTAGDHKNAIPFFLNAIELLPDSAGFHLTLAHAYQSLNRIHEAGHATGKALELEPNDASAHLLMGAILLEQGRNAEARPHYEYALHLSPDDVAIHHGLGIYFLRTGDYDRALSHSREALRLDPLSKDAKDVFIESLMAKNWFYGAFWKLNMFLASSADLWRILCFLSFGWLGRNALKIASTEVSLVPYAVGFGVLVFCFIFILGAPLLFRWYLNRTN